MFQTTLEHFQEKIREKFPNDNLTVLHYTKANSPVDIKCNKCGKIHHYSRGTTLYKSDRNFFCSFCNTKNIRDLQASCKEHNLEILQYGQKVTDQCQIRCNNCGNIFYRTPSTWIKKDCPFCGANKKIIDKNIYQSQLDEIFGKDELKIIDEIPKSHQMTVQHKCGFIHTTSFRAILQSRVCPICEKTASIGERKILSFLDKNHIKYEYQKRVENTRLHFDFYLEDYNLVIEFNGKQHYEPIEIFGGEKRFLQQQTYDNEKEKYCKNNNISLLIIRYDEINNLEKILSNILQIEERDLNDEQ